MAKQILQEQSEGQGSIPGLADLLVDVDNSGRDPERIACAAENVRRTILDGLAGLGKALAVSSQHGGDDTGCVAAIGWLIAELGEFAERLSFIHSDAVYVVSKNVAPNAKP